MVLRNIIWGLKGRASKINEGSFQNKSYEVNFKKISFFILGEKERVLPGGEKEEEMSAFLFI